MTQRSGRFRKKTRHKLRKHPRDRGKVSIRKLLQEFNVGERVRIIQEPAVHKGMPHPRFKNLVGTIVRKQGRAYVVAIKDKNKPKEVISAPVHLERL